MGLLEVAKFALKHNLFDKLQQSNRLIYIKTCLLQLHVALWCSKWSLRMQCTAGASSILPRRTWHVEHVRRVLGL